MTNVNINVITANLVQALHQEHQGVVIQPGQHLTTSDKVPIAQPNYKAWLTYRGGAPLHVETPGLRSDRNYWHRLAVGYEIVIHWTAPPNERGEVFSFFVPDTREAWRRYQISGAYFGGRYLVQGEMDRFIMDHDVPGVIEARNGYAIMVTSVPARFGIVVEWRHYMPRLPQPLQVLEEDTDERLETLGLRGLGSKGLGSEASTYLGKVTTEQGTAQYRPVEQMFLIEAFPMAIPK